MTEESLKDLSGDQLQDLYRWRNAQEQIPHRPTYFLGSMRAYGEWRHFGFKELGQDLQRTSHQMLGFKYSGEQQTLKEKLAVKRVVDKKKKRGLKLTSDKTLTASMFTLLGPDSKPVSSKRSKKM